MFEILEQYISSVRPSVRPSRRVRPVVVTVVLCPSSVRPVVVVRPSRRRRPSVRPSRRLSRCRRPPCVRPSRRVILRPSVRPIVVVRPLSVLPKPQQNQRDERVWSLS